MRKFYAILAALCISVAGIAAFGGCSGEDKEPLETVKAVVEVPAEIPSETVAPEESESGGEATPPTGEWIPEIIDRDEKFDGFADEIDDSEKYEYSAQDVVFSEAHGSSKQSVGEGKYADIVTTSANSLTVCNTEQAPFPYGTLTCLVKTKTNTDSGIVFGVKSGAQQFWEGAGVSYYFFFLGQDGTAYLGKTDNGIWSALSVVGYSFNASDRYELKVVYKGSKICCYVDGELLIAYRDKAPLTGTGFGVRSGAEGVEFTKIALTNEYMYL